MDTPEINIEYLEQNKFSTLDEVDEDALPEDDISHMPYHEQVLYNMFGKTVAESFLRPVIDVSVGVVGLSAKIQNQSDKKKIRFNGRRQKMENITLEKLRNDASRLWEILRENSSNDIRLMDGRIPRELKQSFNSFARGVIDRNVTPPQRCFIDDPEMEKMRQAKKDNRMDKSDLKMRQKKLMANLSRVQEDNQSILLRDKSFLAQTEFPVTLKELYFPPLADPRSTTEPIMNIDNTTDEFDKITSRKIMENFEIPIINDRQLFVPKPTNTMSRNLKFWTEQESQSLLTSDLGFRRRLMSLNNHNNNNNNGNIDPDQLNMPNDAIMSHVVNQARRWHASDEKHVKHTTEYLESINEDNDNRNTLPESYDVTERSSKVANSNKKSGVKFEPLTLGAVMDFKITKKSTIEMDSELGGFRQGAAKVWRPKLARV